MLVLRYAEGAPANSAHLRLSVWCRPPRAAKPVTPPAQNPAVPETAAALASRIAAAAGPDTTVTVTDGGTLVVTTPDGTQFFISDNAAAEYHL